LGWAASYAGNEFEGTCWDYDSKRYKNSGSDCSGYIHPTSHAVRVWISNGEFKESDQCIWTVGSKDIIQPCNMKSKIIDVPYPKGLIVSVTLLGERAVSPKPETIKVTDVLVVGIGDSFGSGEGNPDTPVKLHEDETDPDYYYIVSRQLNVDHMS
jgi:hypothetical protein